nr:MAG TPA: hypothetical protein [Caudoviricetes sp.]
MVRRIVLTYVQDNSLHYPRVYTQLYITIDGQTISSSQINY